jgi:hypothetical protein
LQFTTPLARSRWFASTPVTIGIVVKTPTATSAHPAHFPLIFGEPIRNQQTEAKAKRSPRSSDQHDLWNGKTSLCQNLGP